MKEVVGEDSNGQRIDNFLMKRLKGVPKSHIYQLLRSGQVRLNSKRVDAAHSLKPGDIVRIPPVRIGQDNPLSRKRIAKSALVSFEVLYEDETLMVINKPAGLAVHGGSGVSFGVIEQLRAQHPDWKFLELIHRLDRETSGVLLLAKSRATLVELHRQIRAGQVEKRYLTLVRGRWHNARQSVRLSLNKYVTAAGERRVAVAMGAGDEAGGMISHTVFSLKKSWQDFSLLEAELKTGRTHQIRVHLAHLGFPIAGDDKYGDFTLNKKLASSATKPGLERMFLHAFLVEVTHPVTGKSLRLEAPLAKDLQEFLNGLDGVTVAAGR
ncbi:pseudouridine synthase [Nitrosospira sp. NpAV]|nr:pseudouridine synthase [Nitrosospira sp. NpAV]